MDVKVELEKAFKDYIYNDTNHSYKYAPTNKPLKSVTQFLKSISCAFNVEFWSTLKAFEYSGYTIYQKSEKDNFFIINNHQTIIPKETDLSSFALSYSVQDIKTLWQAGNLLGTGRGTHCHNYLEQIERRDYTERPFTMDCDKETCNIIEYGHTNKRLFEEYAKHNISIKESFINIKQAARNFKKDCDFLIPVAMEFTIGDQKINLAGRFDRLYYNESSGEYEIWDFKTDKKIDYSNRYGKFKIFDVDDCEFEKYSLQTSLYKFIILNNTKIELGDSYIVHFNWKTCDYEIIKTNDYTNLINQKINGINDWTTHL